MSKLKPKTQDSYPDDIAEFIIMNEKQNKTDLLTNHFAKEYDDVLAVNWETEYNYDDRLFTSYVAVDQFQHKHLLPLFLCQIVNPDQSMI